MSMPELLGARAELAPPLWPLVRDATETWAMGRGGVDVGCDFKPFHPPLHSTELNPCHKLMRAAKSSSVRQRCTCAAHDMAAAAVPAPPLSLTLELKKLKK